MKRLISAALIIVASAMTAGAQQGGTVIGGGGVNTRTDNSNDYKPRQRYVCVVPQPQSSSQQYPNVCRATEGRVGGRCRCDGVTGNGTLQLAN